AAVRARRCTPGLDLKVTTEDLVAIDDRHRRTIVADRDLDLTAGESLHGDRAATTARRIAGRVVEHVLDHAAEEIAIERDHELRIDVDIAVQLADLEPGAVAIARALDQVSEAHRCELRAQHAVLE